MGQATEIGSYVKKRIAVLAKDARALEQSSSKANLAHLRRGVGKIPGELPELWGIFLKDMPEELMGKSGEPSYAEWAIYTALTLFALHQQGYAVPMNAEGEKNHFGRAAKKLVHNEDDEENIRKKLSIAAKSEDIIELSYHLKTIIKLLANNEIKLDYADLAKDLYWFQFEEYADRVRLKWGRDFYHKDETNDNRKEENNEK